MYHSIYQIYSHTCLCIYEISTITYNLQKYMPKIKNIDSYNHV